jgi:Uma2 family endonuclease
MVTEPQIEVQAEPMTVADYERLTADTDIRFELIDGELIEMPAPSLFHQLLLAGYFSVLWNHVQERKLGWVMFAPVDVELTLHSALQPDLVFISRSNQGTMAGKRVVGAPDLVVEATSPESRVRDMVRKRNQYQHAEVKEYWLVDTKAQTHTTWALDGRHYVEVPANEDGTARSIVLPDLTIDVDALFAAAME